MNFDLILTFLCVGLASGWLIVRLVKSLKKGPSTGCGSSCGCGEKPRKLGR
jgi:hypothetical protein